MTRCASTYAKCPYRPWGNWSLSIRCDKWKGQTDLLRCYFRLDATTAHLEILEEAPELLEAVLEGRAGQEQAVVGLDAHQHLEEFSHVELWN